MLQRSSLSASLLAEQPALTFRADLTGEVIPFGSVRRSMHVQEEVGSEWMIEYWSFRSMALAGPGAEWRPVRMG